MKGLNPHFHKAIPTEEDCRRIKAQEAHYRPILEKIFAEHFLKLVKSIIKENKNTRVQYTYRWKNNPKRLELYGKPCRILARGRMNSALVEFAAGNKEVVSRNALRRIKWTQKL